LLQYVFFLIVFSLKWYSSQNLAFQATKIKITRYFSLVSRVTYLCKYPMSNWYESKMCTMWTVLVWQIILFDYSKLLHILILLQKGLRDFLYVIERILFVFSNESKWSASFNEVYVFLSFGCKFRSKEKKSTASSLNESLNFNTGVKFKWFCYIIKVNENPNSRLNKRKILNLE